MPFYKFTFDDFIRWFDENNLSQTKQEVWFIVPKELLSNQVFINFMKTNYPKVKNYSAKHMEDLMKEIQKHPDKKYEQVYMYWCAYPP